MRHCVRIANDADVDVDMIRIIVRLISRIYLEQVFSLEIPSSVVSTSPAAPIKTVFDSMVDSRPSQDQASHASEVNLYPQHLRQSTAKVSNSHYAEGKRTFQFYIFSSSRVCGRWWVMKL